MARSVRRSRSARGPRPEGLHGLLEGAQPWPVMVRRGLTKRCPRCGAGGIYHTWLRMKERCGACGFKFEREPGFFIGTYFINFAIAEGFLFALVLGFIFWKNANPDAGVLVPMVGAVLIGTVVPLVSYPYARSIWSAIDLAMRPLELEEIADAAEAVRDEDHPGDRPEQDGADQDGPDPT